MTKKQIPVTIKNIDSLLGKRFDRFEKHFDGKINEAKEELRLEMKHLPTKEQYYAREDKTMGELKKIREEHETTSDLYEKTNQRVNKIDHRLGIDTSVVF